MYTHTFSQFKKKREILPFETTWMDLKDIMVSERSQRRERKIFHDHMIYI